MILIALAGVGAGAINAVVGSGTLITFPTLVALGYPPVTSTMSNAVGLVAGSVSGTWGYRRELRGQWHRLRWQIPASLVGAVLGAWLLLHLPEKVFRSGTGAVDAALILVVIGPRIQAWARRRAAEAGHSAEHVSAAADGRSGGRHVPHRRYTAVTSRRRRASCWSARWVRCCPRTCSG